MLLEALIFDVDGTLAETEELHRRAFNATFAAFGSDWIWPPRPFQQRWGRPIENDYLDLMALDRWIEEDCQGQVRRRGRTQAALARCRKASTTFS